MSQRRGRGAPAGGGVGTSAGARGALLLAVAVILGIVLLQKFDTGISTGGQVSTATTKVQETTTTRRVGLTTVPLATTTTVKARPHGEVKVLVANGAGVRGLGAATTTSLKNLGYAALTPVDATTSVDKTTIQYADGYEAEARELAQALGLPAGVITKLSSPPVAAADIGDAKVIVILGVDITTTSSSTAVAGGTTTTRRL